jgi:CO/xanthine dehydrogenase Mo-binding subunit
MKDDPWNEELRALFHVLESESLSGSLKCQTKAVVSPSANALHEPHACIVAAGNDGQCTVWSSSQGQFMVRAYCAKLLGLDMASIRAIPAEIGGGFGGKTIIYLEPLAYMLSKKSGRPVKLVMSREEVFRGTGPTSGAVVEVKLGAKKDGHITAAEPGQ